jgi:hypothetical protein
VTPRDSHDSDLGGGRQNRSRRRVTRDTTTGRGDKDLSPGDRDDNPSHPANESSYAAAPAVTAPLQQTRWTPGSNQVIHLTLTRPDTAPMTAEQRKEIVTILTAMILDHLQRERTGRTRAD